MKNSMDQIDFNFSRPLDFQKNLDLDFFDNIYKNFIKDNSDSLLEKHIRLLIIELFYCWFDSKEQFLTVSMSKRGYKAQSRYNPNTISSKLILAVKLLKGKGLIEYFPGFFDSKKKISRQTRIRASKKLETEYMKKNFQPFMLTNHKKREFIFLKINNKLSEYKDSFKSHEMRDVMKNYNLLIEKTLIDIPCLKENFFERGDKRKILISQTSLVCDLNCKDEINNIKKMSGPWWTRFDQFCVEKYLKYFSINNSRTNYFDLADFFDNFLELTFNKNFKFHRSNKPNLFNDDQFNHFIIKGINSKNFEGFFRSILNDKSKIGLKENLDKGVFEFLVRNFIEKNSVFADLFFKNMNIGWFEFIDNLFYDLIKKLSNAKIPIFLVRDKILFLESFKKIISQEVEIVLKKFLNLKKINLNLKECYDYKTSKTLLGRFRNKKEISKRYLKKNESFLKFN